MVYVVTVKDCYCGCRGEYVEQVDCLNEAEAKGWVKQFKEEYDRESGYSVKLTKKDV